MAYDIDTDLKALEAMASNLTPYLYENALYGTLSMNLPKLTVGGLLLRLYRLEQLEKTLTNHQQERLRDAKINFEQQRSEWMVHYEGKITHELQARLRDLGNYLNDYDRHPKSTANGYPVEATRRTIIHHLMLEAQHLALWTDELADTLRRADSRLQAALTLDTPSFVWDDLLKQMYPMDDFWWLYSTPSENPNP